MQTERLDRPPAKVLRRSLLHTVGGLLVALAFGLGLPLALLLCGGCQAHTVRGLYQLPVSDSEVGLIKALAGDPASLTAYMQSRPKIDVAGAASDGMETVSAALSLSVDPKTGVMTASFTRANDVNAAAINALGAQVNQLVTTLAPIAQAAMKAAVVAPVPPTAPPAVVGGNPLAGAPAGSTLPANPDDPNGWRPTDLLVKQSVNMRRAMALAADPAAKYGLRAPTADEAARFPKGLLQLGEFLSIVGPNWAADPRVRD